MDVIGSTRAPSSSTDMCSRSEPLDDPPFRRLIPTVADPIVQPARPALPELGRLDHEPPTTPVRRAGNVASVEAGLDLRRQTVELAAGREHVALWRGPRTDLAAPRTRREVGVRLGVADSLDRAAQPHLAMQIEPREHRRGVRVGV